MFGKLLSFLFETIVYSRVLWAAIAFSLEYTLVLVVIRGAYEAIYLLYENITKAIIVWVSLFTVQIVLNCYGVLFGAPQGAVELDLSNNETEKSFWGTPEFVTEIYAMLGVLVCVFIDTLVLTIKEAIFLALILIIWNTVKQIWNFVWFAMWVFGAIFLIYLITTPILMAFFGEDIDTN